MTPPYSTSIGNLSLTHRRSASAAVRAASIASTRNQQSVAAKHLRAPLQQPHPAHHQPAPTTASLPKRHVNRLAQIQSP
jgi:hypothetical protein